MLILDTNTVLRCILQDDKEAALAVNERLALEECLLPIEVIAEIVYVLLKVYSFDRATIILSVSTMMKHKNVRVPHKRVVKMGLHYFGETKLDFVDCPMVGYAIIEGHQIFTFDNKLRKILGIATEPQSEDCEI